MTIKLPSLTFVVALAVTFFISTDGARAIPVGIFPTMLADNTVTCSGIAPASCSNSDDTFLGMPDNTIGVLRNEEPLAKVLGTAGICEDAAVMILAT